MNEYSIEPVVDSELYEVEEIRRLYDLFDVISVYKIQNPLIWGIYTLRKNEMELDTSKVVNEWLLYHATATQNVQSIAENNLDWRLTNRCRYGKGVCFSYCPLYANKYASCTWRSSAAVDYDENVMQLLLNMGFPKEAIKRALFYTYNQGLECATKWLMDHITDYNFAEPFIPPRHGSNKEISIERAFIICRVSVQRIKTVSVNYNLNTIPSYFDTAKSTNGMVYVKFKDYEFYPQYVVYYREHNLSQYNDPYSYSFNYNCVDQ